MATPVNHWKLGLFVVIGAVLAVAAVVTLGAASLHRQHVSYHTYFDESVQGLDIGSPIYFRGVKVGEVEGIGVAPDGRHVGVDMALYTRNLRDLGLSHGNGLDVGPEVRCQLINLGITGLKALQLDFFDPKSDPPPELAFEPGDHYIPAAVSTLKSITDSVEQATDKFPDAAASLVAVAHHADRILDELEQSHLPTVAVDTMGNMNRTLVALQKAIAQADAGGLSKDIKGELARLDQVLAHFDRALARIDGKGGVLDSAQGATDQVKEAAAGAPQLTEEMLVTMREMQDAARSFRRFMDALERDPDMLLKGRGGGE